MMTYHCLGEYGTGKEIDLHHLLINRNIGVDKRRTTTDTPIIDQYIQCV